MLQAIHIVMFELTEKQLTKPFNNYRVQLIEINIFERIPMDFNHDQELEQSDESVCHNHSTT